MVYREATLDDIAQMQVVRHLVKENTLSDPALVPDADVAFHITQKGKGWVCETTDAKIVGFSIVDLQQNSVWALFVDPQYEKRGIGKRLHKLMMNWYFAHTHEKVCLGTAPHTRAEEFYKRQGWTPVGRYANGEVKFEMEHGDWQR